MAKYLVLWRMNPMAPWPKDPAEMVKLTDMMFTQMDALMQKGEVTDFGFFANGTSGYGIGEGDATDEMNRDVSFYPWMDIEVHEIVPYEQGKEIARASWKARAEAMKK